MNNKPAVGTVSEGTGESENPTSITASNAPEGSTLRFYQDEKERNAWFYRWLWRGAMWSILPSIFTAKSLGLVLYLNRFIVVIGLILALLRMMRDRKAEKLVNVLDRNGQNDQEIGWIEKTGIFIGGVGLGMIAISVVVQFALFILKK